MLNRQSFQAPLRRLLIILKSTVKSLVNLSVLTAMGLSFSVMAKAEYRNYCKNKKFLYVESIESQGLFGLSTPASNPHLIRDALFSLVKDYKKNKQRSTGINWYELNRLCQVAEEHGLDKMIFVCRSETDSYESRTYNSATQKDIRENGEPTFSSSLKTIERYQSSCTLGNLSTSEISDFDYENYIQGYRYWTSSGLNSIAIIKDKYAKSVVYKYSASDHLNNPKTRLYSYKKSLIEMFNQIFDPKVGSSENIFRYFLKTNR